MINLLAQIIVTRLTPQSLQLRKRHLNIMYSQLIRLLERRPDYYSEAGKNQSHVLLMMDEFARFGKLAPITSALSTLRSKHVSIWLFVQSVAQLDFIYGERERKIILDNCQFQVILRANDPETQQLLSQLIGTKLFMSHSAGTNWDSSGNVTGYNEQFNEKQEPVLYPHMLAHLNDVIILSPYGLYICEKINPNDDRIERVLQTFKREMNNTSEQKEPCPNKESTNPSRDLRKGANIMTAEGRYKKVEDLLRAQEQKERVEQREHFTTQKRKNNHLNYQIGDLVTQYFPSLKNINLNGNEESLDSLRKLEAILYTLSIEDELLQELEERAEQLIASDPDDEWRLSKVHE